MPKVLKQSSGKLKHMPRDYKLPHNPAPLENDEDSDFNEGAYFSPVKPYRGRGRSTHHQPSASPRGYKRPRDASEESPLEHYKQKRLKKGVSDNNNPLLQFFGGQALESSSEEEGADGTSEQSEAGHSSEGGEYEEDEDSDAEDEDDLPVLRAPTTLALTRTRIRPKIGDNLTTFLNSDGLEPDSESEVVQSGATTPPMTAPSQLQDTQLISPLGKISQRKAEKSVATEADASLTESDSETEAESLTEPESETEAESEVDGFVDENLEPRPAFARTVDQTLLGPLILDAETRVKIPGSINTFLRDYQRDGVRFFYEHFKKGTGALLGDDMGLGIISWKTIQVIAFLSAIMLKHGDTRDLDRRRKHVSQLQNSEDWKERRVLPLANITWPTCLIIAPSSVVGNWERELDTWGYFEVGTYLEGNRKEVLKEFKLGRLDVVLTSFDTARRDIDYLDELPWSCIFIDEVHRVKNPRSKVTVAFNRFQCNCRFGLTGTAIQNGYSELWTILDWTNPGAVGTHKQWERYVAKPLTSGQSRSASAEKHMHAALIAQILRDKFLPLYFLRRTKALIKDQLPEKIEQVVFCPLTANQIEVYKRILELPAVQNMIRKDEPCDCGSKQKRNKCHYSYEQGDLFRYMSTLIKISNHLALILPSPSDTPEQHARNKELAEWAFPNQPVLKYGPAMLKPEYCGKWMVLNALLQEWKKDETNKVLIFTKSVKLLEMLEFHLRFESLGYVKLDGSIKQSDRMPLIDKFHQDNKIFVFLISTLAGGTGLNLTGANKVVIFDPNWNPAHDLQAMDRAYRFGQTRNVTVYRLLGAGSLEELIYARQVYKQQQMAVGYDASLQTRYFEGVQGDKEKQGELFGIKNIFGLRDGSQREEGDDSGGLVTKMAIEQAWVGDLDWALAHMDARDFSKGGVDDNGKKWAYEVETKGKREYGELKGLGTLLFDEGTPADMEANTIDKSLSNIGVNYTHRNEDLIAENAIERQRMSTLLQQKKKTRKTARSRLKGGKATKDPGASDASKLKQLKREPTWPPKRGHGRIPEDPKLRLAARRGALVELGLVGKGEDGESGLAAFAQDFARKSGKEQAEILRRLDTHYWKTKGKNV